METYEEKRKRVSEYQLTSDLFAGKVFEDLRASRSIKQIISRESWKG